MVYRFLQEQIKVICAYREKIRQGYYHKIILQKLAISANS